MRILVVSDSHGATTKLKEIIAFHSDINDIFFLGDNIRDIEVIKAEFKGKRFYAVAGNCDPLSLEKTAAVVNFNGVNILYTHGHTLSVKYGTERLLNTAQKYNCALALYGHTHIAHTSYENGVTLVNPGSIAFSRSGKPSYAVIDVLKQGIVPSIITLK